MSNTPLERAEQAEADRNRLAGLLANKVNELVDERRHHRIAAEEVARLRSELERQIDAKMGVAGEWGNALADKAEALALVEDLRDPDPCWYDHHGYCQAHGWMATDPRCPHARAAELLERVTAERPAPAAPADACPLHSLTGDPCDCGHAGGADCHPKES